MLRIHTLKRCGTLPNLGKNRPSCRSTQKQWKQSCDASFWWTPLLAYTVLEQRLWIQVGLNGLVKGPEYKGIAIVLHIEYNEYNFYILCFAFAA